MTQTLRSITAVAMLVIAANMTYSNFKPQEISTPSTTSVVAQEEVLEVIGRVLIPVDGPVATKGFLVRTSDGGTRVIHYDTGSHFDNEDWQPAYLLERKYGNDRPIYTPAVLYQRSGS